MKRLVCIAMAAMLLVISSCAFAQQSDERFFVALSNPSVEITTEDGEIITSTLTGLELSCEKGATDDGTGYVMELAANGLSALRAVAEDNGEQLLFSLDGLEKAFFLPYNTIEGESSQVEEIDMSIFLKPFEDFEPVEVGREITGFMYGANLTANKSEFDLNNDQINAIIDATSALSAIKSLDIEGLKALEKSLDTTVWITDDMSYIKIETELRVSNGVDTFAIPFNLLGRYSNGARDIVATLFDDATMYTLDLHAIPDDEHPEQMAVNAVFSASYDGQEVVKCTLVSGYNHSDESDTHAMQIQVYALNESVFKLSASKKESSDINAYILKAGLNDELSATYVCEPYQTDAGEGVKGHISMGVNLATTSVSFASDLTAGTDSGMVDTGDLNALEAINFNNLDEDLMNSMSFDISLIGIRAISVLSDIPEIAEFIRNDMLG
ncbi:MAG: hypothetical protein Q4D04_14295 [Clostridia bacterium]|nr:hypothetical protein [Clostridia bacterium]